MKIYKYILDPVGGIDIMALIPLVIFFLFFTGMLCYVFLTNKKHNERMSELPLENQA